MLDDSNTLNNIGASAVFTSSFSALLKYSTKSTLPDFVLTNAVYEFIKVKPNSWGVKLP